MNEKILVVEDDPSALRLIQYTLQYEGYQVLTATNGLAGLKVGADDYVTKPADTAEIVRRVERLLAQKAAAGSKRTAQHITGNKQ